MAAKKKGARHMREWSEGDMKKLRSFAKSRISARVAASKLAARVGRETLPFKTDVRKLKKLGLTQSFEVGYELSPRGLAYLASGKTRRRRGDQRPQRHK